MTRGRTPGVPSWTLVLLPVLVGLAFRAGTSAHGDAVMYRLMPGALLGIGAVPIQPLEWAHPGHFLVIAPFLWLQELLGYGDDPLFLCQLLNFVLHGLLAWTMFLGVRALSPDRSAIPALALGLAVASIPGWLWCSQMPLSDVSGNALILLAAGRFLLHEAECRGGASPARGPVRDVLPYLGTGLCIGVALLMRLSSLAMGPLFVLLGLRVLLVTPRGRRLPRGVALCAGILAPILALYLHWIAHFGLDTFLSIHLRSGGDNATFKADLATLLSRWEAHWAEGAGPVLLVAGLGGTALALLASLLRGHRHPLRSRTWLVVGATLCFLPYLVAVARNQGWFEFRYQVPALFAIALGVPVLVRVAERLAGRSVALVLGVAICGANLAHALPMLEVLGGRQTFTETGVRALAERCPRDAVIPAHYAHPYIDFLCPDRRWIPVHSEEGFGLSHHTFLPPSLVADQCLAEYREGHEIWIMNDPTIHGLRRWLAEQGWREELVWSRSFEGLRNFRDLLLADMSVERALEPSPLRLLRLHPPDDAAPALTHELSFAGDPADAIEVRIHAPPLAGWGYRVLFGSGLAPTPHKTMHWLRLPFAADDSLLAASSSDRVAHEAGLDALEGQLDGAGEAGLRLRRELWPYLREAWSTVLFFRPGETWREARLRTGARPLSELWVPGRPPRRSGEDAGR
ncbi:MAG: hypothetical protein R3F30_15930 [Planctomycetota bacterium]